MITNVNYHECLVSGQMKATKAKGVSSQRPRNIGVGEAYRKGSGMFWTLES